MGDTCPHGFGYPMDCVDCRPPFLKGKVVLLETKELMDYGSRISVNNIQENTWIIAGEVLEQWLLKEGFSWGDPDEGGLISQGVHRWASEHKGEWGYPYTYEVITEVD